MTWHTGRLIDHVHLRARNYLATRFFYEKVLAVLGVLLSWQGPWQLAVVAATFIIGQLAEGFVITPRVVGEKVGLAPVAVIIAVLAFGELFGFVGILLAVPASAILKVVLSVVLQRYRRTQLYKGSVQGP